MNEILRDPLMSKVKRNKNQIYLEERKHFYRMLQRNKYFDTCSFKCKMIHNLKKPIPPYLHYFINV